MLFIFLIYLELYLLRYLLANLCLSSSMTTMMHYYEHASIAVVWFVCFADNNFLNGWYSLLTTVFPPLFFSLLSMVSYPTNVRAPLSALEASSTGAPEKITSMGDWWNPLQVCKKIAISKTKHLITSSLHEIRLSKCPPHICPSCSTTYTRTWLGCPIIVGKFGRWISDLHWKPLRTFREDP